MSAVEDRIVSMKFDNKQFESAASTSLSTFQKLKAALGFKGATNGLDNVQKSVSRINLGPLSSGVQAVSQKFSLLGTAAAVALGNIASKAASVGASVAKSFTIDPMIQGFQEYETNLNSIQTILANTQSSGAKLGDVNAALKELNLYADKTIYNFSEMARNIGTFTAAGVDLETSTASIKGIANLAALSGSNSMQASTAMYQLSQAISAGRVSLQDWNSVVNAGMGGTVFQRALATTAENMGTLDKGAVKLSGSMKNVTIGGKSFRESITAKPGEESWLTSEVLTTTLQQFTGDLTDAELAAQGFTKEQIKAIQATAKTAQGAATEVKTFTGLMDTLKEGTASGWAQTFETIIGDFEESKKLWTAVSNVVGGVIGKSSDARNKMLADWKELGGRTAMLEGLRNVFTALGTVMKPIGKAFGEMFPPLTGQRLFDLTQKFLEFTKGLSVGKETLTNIGRTAKGFFAIFSIGISAIKGILGFLGDLFGLIGKGSGGFLETTASVGDFLVRLDESIKKGKVFERVFDALFNGLKTVGKTFGAFAQVIGGFVKNLFDLENLSIAGIFDALREAMTPLKGVAEGVGSAFGVIGRVFSRLADFFAPAIEAIGQAVSNAKDALVEGFKDGDFSAVYAALNTGLLAGILFTVKNFLDNGLKVDIGEGLLGSITESFGALTGVLETMQTQIHAKILLQIAIAVGLLVLSMVALSKIDGAALAKSLGGLATAMGFLLLAMKILTGITGLKGFTSLPLLVGGMIGMAAAVAILTIAIKELSELGWEDLAKGLVGVAGAMLIMSGAAALFGKSGPMMFRAGLAMIPLAFGLQIMADAVKDFADMSWADLAKGLVGVAGALLIISGAVALMPPTMIAQAAGLLVIGFALQEIGEAMHSFGDLKWGEIGKGMVVLAGGLTLIAAAMLVMPPWMIAQAAGLVVVGFALQEIGEAMHIFGDLKWGEIGKGLTVIAASLVLIAAAMLVFPPNMALQAFALILVANAMVVMGDAIKSMGQMSWGEIGKGLTTLGLALVILALGLTAMIAAMPGAAALLVAVTALEALVPVLQSLGDMTWGEIAKGLIAIGLAFGVLAGAAALLLPLTPAMFIFAGALVVLGAGMALVGLGALALASAFSIFAAAGTAGIAVLSGMLALIPQFMTQFALGIVNFVTTLANSSAEMVEAFKTLLLALLDAITEILPALGEALIALVKFVTDVLIACAPMIATAAVTLFSAIMTALNEKMPEITEAAAGIIKAFLDGMNAELPGIIDSATTLIVTFLNGIERNNERIVDAGVSLVISLITAIVKELGSRANSVTAGLRGAVGNWMRGLASAGLGLISTGVSMITNLISRIVSGLSGGVGRVTSGAQSLANGVRIGIQNTIGNILSTAQRLVTDLSSRLSTGLSNAASRAQTAASNIGSRITSAISGAVGRVRGAASNMAAQAGSAVSSGLSNAASWAYRSALSVGSNVISGMVNGIAGGFGRVASMAASVARSALNAAKSALGVRSPSREFMKIGAFSSEGLAIGLKNNSDLVVRSGENVAKEALRAMQNAMLQKKDILGDHMDLRPKIVPVLDLSSVERESRRMSGFMTAPTLGIRSYLGQARDISDRSHEQREAMESASIERAQTILNFTQNNTSPESLSPADIYLQTHNQLALAKKEF